MRHSLAKLLIVGGFLLTLFVVWRGFLYAPNDLADSGLKTNSAAVLRSLPEGNLPARLIIPKLDINAKVERLGVTKKGNMAAPNNFTDISWYKYGTAPGMKGSAVMAGHVDNALGVPAVFYRLKDLELGDEVIVERSDGKRLRFEVVDKEIYPYDDAPLKRIFNASDDIYLNLITCQGEWVREAKSAAFRLVVYTKLME